MIESCAACGKIFGEEEVWCYNCSAELFKLKWGEDSKLMNWMEEQEHFNIGACHGGWSYWGCGEEDSLAGPFPTLRDAIRDAMSRCDDDN